MGIKESSSCFHCHLPVPTNFNSSLEYKGIQRNFCCMGCFSIAETIIDNGLDDYYKFRTSVAPKADALIPEELAIFDEPEVLESLSTTLQNNFQSIELICENLQCSACGWLIEKQIGNLTAVKKVTTSITNQLVYLEWAPQTSSLSDILKSFHALGYPVKPYQEEQAASLQVAQEKSWLKRLGLAGLGMMQVMMYAIALYIGAFDGMESSHKNFLQVVSFLVATPVLFYSGFPFFRNAYKALRGFQLNMDVPISLALILAYTSSIWAIIVSDGEVYFDSVTMFVFFLLIGRYLEYRARQKVQHHFVRKDLGGGFLIEKINFDENGNTLTIKTVPIQKVAKGDILNIKPGKTIAVDGVIIRGESSVNEAMLNGEFMPVNKSVNDTVLAGSINGDIPIQVKVTQLVQQSFISKVQKMQRQAFLEKSDVTLIADKVARYFIMAILSLAILTFFTWSFIEPSRALWITIAVLVVSCPCALSLATPVALTCGTSSLNKNNILIQDKNFLQKLSDTTDVILDKTGTLTKGNLFVEKVTLHSSLSKEEVLSMIATMEADSEHPIAKAFSNYLSPAIIAENILLTPFAGVSATINSKAYWFGNQAFIENNTQAEINLMNENSLLLTTNEKLLAEILLTDEVRDDALLCCENLQTNGKTLHLLSGDPSDYVEKLAAKLNIANWRNNLNPEQKLEYIKAIKRNNPSTKILTIGDGINDAPAMAISDTSIAMTGASDLTKSQADSYLLSGNLSDVNLSFGKSEQTNKKIRQNILWAICYNIMVIPFAIMGLIPPYLAAIGMSLSSIVVVLNSLSLNPKD